MSDSLFKRPSSEVKMLRTPILLDGILRLFFAEINGWNKTKNISYNVFSHSDNSQPLGFIHILSKKIKNE